MNLYSYYQWLIHCLDPTSTEYMQWFNYLNIHISVYTWYVCNACHVHWTCKSLRYIDLFKCIHYGFDPYFKCKHNVPGTFGNTLVTTLMCNYLQSHEHLIVTIIHGLLTDIPSSCKKPNIDVHFCSRLLIHPVI